MQIITPFFIFEDKKTIEYVHNLQVVKELSSHFSTKNQMFSKVYTSENRQKYHDYDDVLDTAEASASATHNHKEGIRGAQATALAVFLAKNGQSKDDIKKEIEFRFGYNLSNSLDSIRPTDCFDVSCQGTVPVAIRAFLESWCYEDAIRNAVSDPPDRD